MKLKLYHYVHCPFCVRVRLGLGYLGLAYESSVLPYNDETTPVSLTGVKMLPIMEIDGKPMNESLDILEELDTKNLLRISEYKSHPDTKSFEELLNKLGKNVHNLAMPYWIWTPEFDSASREYFQKKKEAKRGPFKDLVRNSFTFSQDIQKDLRELAQDLKPFYRSDKITIKDIMLAAHLWGLYVVPEFQFSPEIHNYLQTVKKECHFNYHQDFWK